MEKPSLKKIINMTKTKLTFFISVISLGFLYLLNLLILKPAKPLRYLSEDKRSEGPNEICMEIHNNDLFSLFPLKDIETKVNNDKIHLKFCQNINNTGSSVIYQDGNITTKLAGNIYGEENNKNKIEVNYNEEDETKNKVNLYLAYGDKIGTSRYKVNIFLNCKKDVDFNCLETTEFDINKDELNITADSKYACGQRDVYSSMLEKNYIPAGIILIIAGGFLGLFGYKKKEICIYLVCLAGGLYLFKFLDDIFDLYSEYFVISIVIIVFLFIISIVNAIIIYIKKSLFKYYVLLIGGLLGYSIGFLINSTIILIINTSYQKVIQIIIYVVLVIAGVICGRFAAKISYIIGTSIIGSYGLMRGISLYLKDKIPYLNEQKIYDLAHTGNFEKVGEIFSGWFYIYPAMLLVFTIICIIVQYSINPSFDDIEDYKLLEKEFGDTKLVKDYRFSTESEDEIKGESGEKQEGEETGEN
jgi:hypothetical protein